jgi:hypothetical protein
MSTYKRHRFPPDIISSAVWLYYRINLDHRDYGDTFHIDEVFAGVPDHSDQWQAARSLASR